MIARAVSRLQVSISTPADKRATAKAYDEQHREKKEEYIRKEQKAATKLNNSLADTEEVRKVTCPMTQSGRSFPFARFTGGILWLHI